MYKLALERGKIDSFLTILSSPVAQTTKIIKLAPVPPAVNPSIPHPVGVGERIRQEETVSSCMENLEKTVREAGQRQKDSSDRSGVKNLGCGLAFVARAVKEHYSDQSKRSNNLSIRLIGRQAIALAKYSYRLIDSLETENETGSEKLHRQALRKATQCLRDAGALFNKVDTNQMEVSQLKDTLISYFNLLSLFFPSSVNVTVWTVAYAIPYHAQLLYDKYKVGFGILSLQAKESKHSGVKHDLALTNRSRSTGSMGKWAQVMRANYVRAFYLPEHQPMPSMYVSHYESRVPSQTELPSHCECGRERTEEGSCFFCSTSSSVIECAMKQELTADVISILKPLVCSSCQERFTDHPSLQNHTNTVHQRSNQQASPRVLTDPRQMKLPQLKEELKKRGLSTTGSKTILVTRLQGALVTE